MFKVGDIVSPNVYSGKCLNALEVAVVNSDNTFRAWNKDRTETIGCFRCSRFSVVG